MNATIKKTTFALSCALLLSSAPVAQASIKPLHAGAAVFLAATVFRYATKKSTRPDYQAQGDVKKLLDVRTLLTDPKGYVQEWIQCVDDYIIGQAPKKKSITTEKNSNKIVVQDAAEAYGIYGNIEANWQPALTALGVTTFCADKFGNLSESWDKFTNFEFTKIPPKNDSTATKTENV